MKENNLNSFLENVIDIRPDMTRPIDPSKLMNIKSMTDSKKLYRINSIILKRN